MLIRSQDKKSIVNLDNIMQITVVIPPCSNNEYAVIGNGAVMGTYSTEEKAIKVLDMIQNTYVQYGAIKNGFGDVHGAFNLPKVFQMPQDSEV